MFCIIISFDNQIRHFQSNNFDLFLFVNAEIIWVEIVGIQDVSIDDFQVKKTNNIHPCTWSLKGK